MAETIWCRARLTNRRALCTELGLPLETPSPEVVRAAIATWQSEAPQHLRGAWAFAQKTGSHTVITRDHVGALPTYWARLSHGELLISDSVQELIDQGVDPAIHPDLANLGPMGHDFMPPTRTVVKAIHRVPPGSRVTITHSSEVVDRWWKPELGPRNRPISIDRAAQELRTLLRSAISDCIDSCQEAGGAVVAHVSGGLDSTAVAILAQQALTRAGESLLCLASWSPGPEAITVDGHDERAFIEAVSSDVGVPVAYGPNSYHEADWLAALDIGVQPRSTLMRESQLIPDLAARGARHVLTGWGGDEFASFNGRGTTRAIMRTLNVPEIWAAYRGFRSRGDSRVRSVQHLLGPTVPESWRPGALRDRLSTLRPGAQRPPASPAPGTLMFAHERRYSTARNPREVQLALLDRGHLSQRIESWHEAGRRFGITYHHPLLDPRIIEWALSVPPQTYRVGPDMRRVFRLAVDGLVPDDVRDGMKADPALFALAARERDAHRDAAEE